MFACLTNISVRAEVCSFGNDVPLNRSLAALLININKAIIVFDTSSPPALADD